MAIKMANFVVTHNSVNHGFVHIKPQNFLAPHLTNFILVFLSNFILILLHKFIVILVMN
jgi:hypothetical protein